MGRHVGIEPTYNGTTIRRVNHFTNIAMSIEFVINININNNVSQYLLDKFYFMLYFFNLCIFYNSIDIYDLFML